MEVNVDGLCGYCDFIIHTQTAPQKILMAGVFERSKVKARALACRLAYHKSSIGYRAYIPANTKGWDIGYSIVPLGKGRDRFVYASCVSREVNDNYVITSNRFILDDVYDFLMKKYKLPLLKRWVGYIVETAIDRDFIEKSQNCYKADDDEKALLLHSERVLLRDIVVLDFTNLDDSRLQEIVSTGLRKKEIWISEKQIPPLKFNSFDDYINQYGKSLVDNIEKEIHPLVGLKGEVDGLALKHKRLYPQQAACVNGMIALKKHGIKYAIANEGMGTGKTIQGAAVVEASFIEDWLKKHPDKTLYDAYQKDVINYRCVVMCPGHLVEKWAAEIEKEIPFAKATILRDFSQLVELREHGKARHGKEFLVLSKDFAKLGAQDSPSPTVVKRRYLSVPVCADCLQEGKIYYMKGFGKDACCPDCNGKRVAAYPLTNLPKVEGLICPECGELLLNSKNLGIDIARWEDDPHIPITLKPSDFARHTSTNSACRICNASLWGVNAKPLDMGGEYSSLTKRPSKWHKISYFKNHKKKSIETSWVMRGYENSFTYLNGITSYNECGREYGPRKFAPSHYIKKYLRGFFDVAILDEVHKFEGAGTAQANAAHALIQASDFTLGLTGTIANGSAASFFFLLFMLDPVRMRKHGYEWSSASYMEFVKKYGSVQSTFEYSDAGDDVYNKNSRGRQITEPKPVPGISPMLFVDFLLDRCVFLDITDLSKFLPELKEQVITCKLPNDIQHSYDATMGDLKEALHSVEGKGAMTSILQFGLSYPDKPYGREPIMSGFVRDMVLADIANYDEYDNLDCLLPKEEKMIELINQEIAENRNCFVYASYTGDGETNITGRLQLLIEKHCNLKGRVQIIQASSPAPLKREEWIQKRASEGVRVFITNPKCVETGLDFCFNYKGCEYNYPTLIFMQMSYEMSVIWQASRRAYRLNQKSMCKTYYLAYENTLQTAALEIMAEKQVATSAIQGKFSSEGLAAMAKGVDTRTKLASALAANDMSDRNTLTSMFDALNQQNNASDDDAFGEYIPPKTYYELIGKGENESTFSDLSLGENGVLEMLLSVDEVPNIPEKSETVENVPVENVPEPDAATNDLFRSFFGVSFETLDTAVVVDEKKVRKADRKKAQSKKMGQDTIFDLFNL